MVGPRALRPPPGWPPVYGSPRRRGRETHDEGDPLHRSRSKEGGPTSAAPTTRVASEISGKTAGQTVGRISVRPRARVLDDAHRGALPGDRYASTCASPAMSCNPVTTSSSSRPSSPWYRSTSPLPLGKCTCVSISPGMTHFSGASARMCPFMACKSSLRPTPGRKPRVLASTAYSRK